MNLAVSEIQAFYAKTELGLLTRRFINESIQQMDPYIIRSREKEILVSYGYSFPYLERFTKDLSQTLYLMPEQQGVISSSSNYLNTSILIEQTEWPLDSESTNIVLMIHGLETCENPNELLEETWRVLSPEGYLLVVVPNRTGFWARSDLTPFGNGRPYSLRQLARLLSANKFEIIRTGAALFSPPAAKGFFLKSSPLVEKFCKKYATKVMGGILIMLVKKKIYAPTAVKLSASIKTPLGLLDGLIEPKPKPLPNHTKYQIIKENKYSKLNAIN
ncbi:MAG: hypothetical protein CML37_00350 [Rhodobacteraceae bacterium]|nr:hypothetical protein [Paracoccaceae bacterium]